MDNSWTILYEFSDPIKADLMKNILLNDGIQTIETDVNAKYYVPFFSAYTGTKLLVKRTDFKKALELIAPHVKVIQSENLILHHFNILTNRIPWLMDLDIYIRLLVIATPLITIFSIVIYFTTT